MWNLDSLTVGALDGQDNSVCAVEISMIQRYVNESGCPLKQSSRFSADTFLPHMNQEHFLEDNFHISKMLWKDRSPAHVLVCLRRLRECENCLRQAGHWNGFSPVCVFMCLVT